MVRSLVFVLMPFWFVACARMTIDPVVMSPSIPATIEKGAANEKGS